MKTICVSGYFNPLHIGHLDMIKEAKSLGDRLVVIVNNDEQVKLKESVPFMKFEDRLRIVSELRDVDEAFGSIDIDKTVCKSLDFLKPDIFANGGDRKNESEIPEAKICKKNNIEMIFNLG